MAKVFKFRWDTTDLNLLAVGDAGLRFQQWRPASASPRHSGNAAPVVEVIDVLIDGSSDDVMSTHFQALDQMRVYADRYMHDPTFEEPVWLHAQMLLETGGRRALVRRIDMEWLSGQIEDSGPRSKNAAVVRLHVEREPWWEGTASTSITQSTPVALNFDSGSTKPTMGETVTGATSADTMIVVGVTTRTAGTWGGGSAIGTIWGYNASGAFQDNENLNGSVSGANFATSDGLCDEPVSGMFDYTLNGDIAGDIPARLDYMTFSPMGAYELGRVWAGIRTDQKVSNPEYFACLWELEEGSGLASGDCTAETDAGNLSSPRGGTGDDHIQLAEGVSATDWDDGDFHAAWEIRIEDVAQGISETDAQELIGTHLLLLRAYVGASTVWEVQLRLGYDDMPTGDFWELRKVEIADTSYNIYDMGIVTLPPRNYRAIGSSMTTLALDMSNVVIHIWARRTAGTNDLFMDCIMPIPLDEGHLIMDGSAANATSTEVWFGQGPLSRDRQVAVYDSSNWVEQVLMPKAHNFALPPGDGRMIVVHARQASSVLADGMLCSEGNKGAYFERWGNLRGGE